MDRTEIDKLAYRGEELPNDSNIFDEIYCRTEMIKSLVDMRNRLLPKLMSGEVEV